jgi:hypothetical protein
MPPPGLTVIETRENGQTDSDNPCLPGQEFGNSRSEIFCSKAAPNKRHSTLESVPRRQTLFPAELGERQRIILKEFAPSRTSILHPFVSPGLNRSAEAVFVLTF